MELHAITGQLYLVNGNAIMDTPPPGLWVQAPPTRAPRGRHQDYLFIHLTLSGPAEETADLAQELLEILSTQFYKIAGSVTSALQQAITITNKKLLHRNVNGKDTSREGALICAVLRNNELYMAQVGESFALLGHNFGVEKLPASPPARITPLGRTAGLDIRFYHNWLEAEHVLLLADPRIAHFPVDTLRPALIAEDIGQGIDILQQQLSHNTARLLLIGFTDEEVESVPEPTPAPLDPQRAQSESIPEPHYHRGRTIPLRLPDIALENTARQATSQAVSGLGRFTGWLATLMQNLSPPSRSQNNHDNEGWSIPLLIAIVVPIVVAVIVTYAYWQWGETERLSDVKNEMKSSLLTAQTTDIETDAEYNYQQVIELANSVTELRRNDVDISQMRLEAMTGLDRLHDITRLTSYNLYTFPEETKLSSVALREGEGGEIYTLDPTSNTVWLHKTTDDYFDLTVETPEAILVGNQAVSNHAVGTVVDLLWRPKSDNNSRAGIGVLDTLGAFLTHDSTRHDNRVAPLPLASQWQLPRAIKSFNERLYVLDQGAQTLWRYYPEGEGFDIRRGQESVFFEDADALANVVDFVILPEDGSVIILYADGRLRNYEGGRMIWDETDVFNSGLDKPLVSPVAIKIVGPGLGASVFVADAGNDRIVQVSVSGNYLAQFKARNETGIEQFGAIHDFAVATTPLRIVAIAGNDLFITVEE